MTYIESSLIPGEKLIYQTRLHWAVMLGHLVLGCLLFVCSMATLYWLNHGTFASNTTHIIQGGALALLLAGIVTILIGMVRRNATEIAVTSRRVVIKQGLISRKTIEMLLNKIEAIEVREPTLGRIMGYGTIVVIGTGGTSEPFHKIAHPLEFRSQVQQQLEKLLPQGLPTPEKVGVPVP